jgi:hypothetical protein
MMDSATAQPVVRPGIVNAPITLRALGHTLVISGIVAAVVAVAIFVGLDGWPYYAASVSERGYMTQHPLLRPSGRVGQPLGVAGFLLMLVPVAYAVRKKVRRLREVGSLKTWLEIHVFCGIVGPVLVSFHTAFKFNGLVSVAYWSMVLVALSGVVGRYLYVRIPRSLRGQELTRAEIDARAQKLGEAIAAARLPERTLAEIETFERRTVPAENLSPSWYELAAGELRLRRAIRQIHHKMNADRASSLHHAAIALVAERATLLRRTAYLKKTKKIFDLWHVFHMPLVYAMFSIVLIHVGFTLYLGYVPFGD